MCDIRNNAHNSRPGVKTVPLDNALGMVLAHDITEIRAGEFKGRAFKKGHIIRDEDVRRLRKLGKEHLFVITISGDEMHEDDAAYVLAHALMGEGVGIAGEPKEGKINIIAERDGLLKINKQALTEFNMLGEVMCATLHDNTMVKKGRTVAGTRAIPLVVKKDIVEGASAVARASGGVIDVREMRSPKVGVVITGNEVYYGRTRDAFAPVITRKVHDVHGELVGIYFAPDNEEFIAARLNELIEAGADLLITTGGMSVDPDDITRFAVKKLGAGNITYGSAVLPGAMFMIAYLNNSDKLPIPILGIPACGMYHKTTVFDLVLPRVLAGEIIGRKELAELGHGGLCMNCKECRYPACSFGK